MKPHLPIALLSILMGTHIAQAIEIPDDYEQIDLWTPSYLDDYTSNTADDYRAFILWTDITFSPSTNDNWTSTAPLISGGNIIFTSSEGYEQSSLNYTNYETTIFEQPNTLTFDSLRHLCISSVSNKINATSINLGEKGSLKINNITDDINGSIDVRFSNNQIQTGSNTLGGGAIYGGKESSIEISHNGSVEFCDNIGAKYTTPMVGGHQTLYGYRGGAILSSGILHLTNNENIYFNSNLVTGDGSGRTSTSGGAIHTTQGFSISNNKGIISFTNNSASIRDSNYFNVAASGGALHAVDGEINNNGKVYFSGNFARAHQLYTSTTAIASGGAIHSTGELNLSHNNHVEFSFNYVESSDQKYFSESKSLGGAIYSNGSLYITGNDAVLFQKNYEKIESIYRLRSIYIAPDSSGDNLVLAAKTGGHITFNDSVYMVNKTGATVSFNADYEDVDGVTQKAGGDIIFSGKYTADHLAEVKGSTATTAEIMNSQTSEINNLITLYGGSLQVVDGAKLNGHGLTVTTDSGAKLLLRDGSMNHGSYDFTFNNGTTLELQGLNTITAKKVTLGSGANLTVTIGKDNLNTAALTLGGTDLSTSKLTVNLNRTDGLTSGMYKIISQNSTSDFTTKSAWSAENVTVNGSGDANRATFSDLVWENGTLYYKVERTIWGNASGDRLWNTSSDNWTMNDRSYTYLDGMDVTFTDLGAGEVKLVGDVAPADILVNNSEGNDYTFTAANGGGKLVGSTGITKNGTGALTITTANKHTGATVLNAGTLHVHHSTALGATAAGGTATVTTLAGTTLAIDNNSHVVLAGENSIAGNVNVAEGASLELKNAGYSAATSTVDGTLSFTGTKASTNNVGSLSGTGSVQVTDSNVSFASQSKFTGNLSVQGANASLSISSGAYNGGGALSAQGNGAHLNLGSNNVTIKNGGQLKLSSEITETNSTAAKLTANNVTISKGASLSVQGARPEAIADDGSISILTLAEYDADLALNRKQIGIADVTKLTISSGATYEALYGNLSLAQGELTLAVPSSVADKIQFVVRYDGEYNADVQVVLFTDVKTANFIYNGETITATGSQKYTLHAADYFVGEAINTNTQLVYENGTVYLTGVNNVIPEPATATLSLLALAALAARRRRK